MLPQKTPGEGKRKRIPWQWDRVEAGTKFHAWIAGPTLWCTVHRKTVSKGCPRAYLGDQADCPLCDAGKEPEPIGYMCLVVEGVSFVSVCVQEYHREHIDRIPLHAAVRVRRSAANGAPVLVDHLDREKKWVPSSAEYRVPQDVSPLVLQLWGCPEITAAFGGVSKSPPQMPRVDRTPRAIDEEAPPELVRRVQESQGDGGERLAGESMDDAFRRVTGMQPSRNGSHPPSGE